MSAAAASYRETLRFQSAFELIGSLCLTCYLFPPQADVIDKSCYDYIIVGGGTSGCVLANRLTEDPKVRVLLLEAGKNPPIEAMEPGLLLYAQGSNLNWNFEIKPNNCTFQCQLNRTGTLFLGKVLGGTSSLGIELYQRGQPDDYNNWADLVQDPSWKWKNILPLFKKSEKLRDSTIANSPYSIYHGFNGLFGVTKDHRDLDIYNFLEAYKETGHDIVVDMAGNGSLGYGKGLVTIDKGYRSNSAYAYLTPIKNRRNLDVLREAYVTKIILNKDKTAVGVEVMYQNRKIILKAKKEVIISAGPVKSPQLLMLSGIGPAKHLQHMGIKTIVNLPVGKKLYDHISVILGFILDTASGPPGCQEPYNPHLYTAPVYVGKVSLNKDHKVDYTTINYIVQSDDSIILNFCQSYYRYDFDICEKFAKKEVAGKQILFVLVTLAYPKSRGTVKLRSKDPKDSPVIDPGYFSDPEDLKVMVACLKHYMKIMKSTYFKKMNAKFLNLVCPRCKEKRGDEFWECYALCMMKPMNQLGAACAMGSVVDNKLKVLGVKNLRVVDASIMPTLTADDTIAPTVMIGEKAAIMIKQDNLHRN